jgi:peptide deformylase
MHAAPGVGLAAPQVGVTRRVFVVDLSVGEDADQLHVFVNPRSSSRKDRWPTSRAACRSPSCPRRWSGRSGSSSRPRTFPAKPFRIEAEDWLARAICHENDHLDGVLFVDRLRGLRREKARRQLKKMIREREEVTA